MPRSHADRARERADEHPFLIEALAAGVVNYTAAARFLFEDPDEEAVATALRRYAEDLSRTAEDRTARVSMESGVGVAEDPDDPLLGVAGTAIAPGAGELTALVVTGEGVDASALGAALGRLSTAGIEPVAAGGADGGAVVVVERADGADALRVIEGALDAVPDVRGVE